MDKPNGGTGSSKPEVPRSEMEYRESTVVRRAIIIIHGDGTASLIDVPLDGMTGLRVSRKRGVLSRLFSFISNMFKKRRKWHYRKIGSYKFPRQRG